MRNVTAAAKVGFLSIAGLVAALALYREAGEGGSAGSGYRVHVYFRDASGLVARSRVLIAGIPVGSIEAIALAGEQARLTLRIDRAVKLYVDATAAKRSVSILGEYNVVLTPGTPGLGRIKPGGTIPTAREGATPDRLLEDIAGIAERIREVADNLARAFGTEEGGAQMRSLLQNMSTTAESIRAMVEQNSAVVSRTLGNFDQLTAQSIPEIREILVNARVITEQVRGILGRGEEQVGSTVGSIQGALASVQTAAETLQRTMAHVERVAAGVEAGQGTVGRMLRDDALINDVEGVVRDAGEIMAPIARLQTIVGLRTEYNVEAQAFRNYVELRLQPREDKYYLLQIVSDTQGLTRTREAFENVDGGPTTHRRTVTSDRDALRFSLQFAQRIGMFTGRFGIVESTGGVGLDLHLLDDRIEMRNALFAFGVVSEPPRFRTMLSYELMRRIWILAGVDDVFIDRQRDYFGGLQLRFSDDDLKALLAFGPSLGSR